MDPKNNAPSFLKLIDDYDPIFLKIPYDFASLLLGGKAPYGQCFELIDDDLSWVVRLKRNVSGPVLGDGFTKFVKDSGLKKNDYLLVNAIGTSTFYVSVSKSCVFENSFISKVAPDDTFIFLADKFWKDFYGERFKGGEATLYVGNRYWNVKMEGWPDISAFTDGFSKLIDDISLDTRYTMLFTSVGYKTFEVSIFNHLTFTEIYFKKVDVVVLDDSIYGDEGFDLLTAISSKHKEKHETNESHVEQDLSGDSDTEDSKFDRHIAAQIEMEDAKNLVSV
ncbi:putative transcription factor B3-Domain family [Helianthus annuus]|nr:putative transcription factor B3-Domain family [Helianthus annuus]